MRLNTLRGVGRPVTSLCVGTSPLGNLPTIHGYVVDEAEAHATINTVFDSDLRFIDTSNAYGEAEARLGRVIRERGVPNDLVIATKADPSGKDFSRARIHASFEESRRSLALSRFPVYYLHDPERFEFDAISAPDGALTGMMELRDAGLVDAIGLASGDVELTRRYLDLDVFDIVLNHNRYTLLDRSAIPLIEDCAHRGVSFVNAAPFASGLLAKGAGSGVRYQYAQPSPDALSALDRVQRICDEFEVALPAVALGFSTRDVRVSSTVVGMTRPERVAELLSYDATSIPDEIWPELANIEA